MIPLTRCSRRRIIETALLSCSRQSLPRPARLYSTPTKKLQAPALETTHTPPADDFATYMNKPSSSGPSSQGLPESLQSFLRGRTSYTFLPTPLPPNESSPINDFYFPDSPTQDSLAVIHACLHNSYDVRRAKYVFDQLREQRRGDPVLQPRLYNSILEGYLDMASQRDVENRELWLGHAWNLFEAMEGGEESVAPVAGTYAIMLKIWNEFNSTAETPSMVMSERSPSDLLRCLTNRQIPVTSVVSDHVFASKEAGDIVQHLSRAAAELGLSKVIVELGQAESIATDPFANVPQVIPVTRTKSTPVPLVNLPKEELEQAMKEISAEDEDDVPFNLSNLRKHLAEVAFARRVLPDDAAARQKLLEASVYDVAVHRLRHDTEKLHELDLGPQGLQSAQLQKWMFNWHEKLQKRLTAEIELLVEEEAELGVTKRDTVKRMRLGPFLSLLKPQKLSLITILELMRLSGTGGVTEGMKTARALLTIGKAVELEHKAEVLKKNNIQVPQASSRPGEMSYFTNRAYDELREWRMNAANYIEGSSEWTSDWTHAVRARVGSFLVDSLMDIATVQRSAVDKRTGEEVFEDQPAFYHSYEYLRGHKLGVIRLNSVVAERLAKDDIRPTLHPRHLPMLIKPKPWLSHDNGGYLFNKSSVMRLKDTQEQLTYLRHASTAGHVELIFAGLDVLGSTPWKINRAVFDIVLEVWNTGKRFAKIPPATFDMPEPEKPENISTDPGAKARYITRMKVFQDEKAGNHSNRCNVNYRVEIARAFLGDTMYLPHNIDFRGRAYPIPPHLSHIGDDLSRGLLKFAETKPLGKSGLRWLKIHLANLAGYDKGNFDERVQFVHDHLEDIYDSAEKPLEGRQWWTTAGDPWQCLAACIELNNALKSGDAEAFESSLPVHQDGTCNGLQHYAALGGDIKGAKQVNLDVTDRPADVYTHVAEKVEEVLRKEAEKGDESAQLLVGKISRKVVKQTVMTTVYGVTYIGARKQLERQLNDRGDIPADKVWNAAAYLAKHVLACIGDTFSGARTIQTWLTLSARLIAKSIPRSRVEDILEKQNRGRIRQKTGFSANRLAKEQMTSVVWTTPLGLPIVQPYRKPKRKQIMTRIQTVYIGDPNSPAEVNATKQASAFPPNFIHSLDATHMMLTALECRKHNLSFASVHDSYWTHAATIDKMNEIIRDTFIALHESDVLEKLQNEFLERYKDYQIPLTSLRGSSFLERLGVPKETIAILAGSQAVQKTILEAEGPEVIIDGDKAEVETSGEHESVEIAEHVRVESIESAEIEDEGENTSDAAPSEMPKRKRRSKADPENVKEPEAEAINKFVNLVDLLPPLPKKGTFDVKTIKNSQYFFS